jgi:hypothetical protein
MKGIKILIGAAAITAAGAGAAGILMNTKKARMKRLAKKTGRIMYAVGSVLQIIACPNNLE